MAPNRAARQALAETTSTRLRTELEAAAADASIQYRRRFEATQDGILILDFDTARIVDANPFIVDLLGYTLEELQGKALWDIGEFASVGLNKSAFAVLQKQGYLRYEDLPLETKAGRRAEVEFISNVYDVGGRKTIQCNIRDISERKQAEAMQRRLAAIIESSSDAIISEDLTGTITAWNKGAERIYGYAAGEAIGKPVSILAPKGHPDDTAMLLDRARRGMSLDNFDTQRVRKDGKTIDVAITMSPLRSEAGAIIGASGIVRDITEEKDSRISLQRANRSLVLLGRSNYTLVNLKDEPTLLVDFCRLV